MFAEQLKHPRRFTLPFIPFGAVTAPEPDVGTIVVPEKQNYVNFYNAQRIHSALRYKLADEVYFGTCNWSK